MDHFIVNKKKVVEGIIHGFYDFLKNDFVHHVDIQVKIFKPSPF
jgi:hypothetical protein